METWKFLYYSFLILCLIVFFGLFFVNLYVAFAFAVLVLLLSNWYITKKEPARMNDLNRSALPLFLVGFSVFVTMFSFVMGLRLLLPYPFNAFLVFLVVLPGILLCIISFNLSKNLLMPKDRRFLDALKFGFTYLPFLFGGPLGSSAGIALLFGDLENNKKLTPGDSRLFFVYGFSPILIAGYLLVSILWVALVLLFAKH